MAEKRDHPRRTADYAPAPSSQLRTLRSEDGIGSSGLRRDLALLQALASDDARARGGLGVVRLAEMLQRDKSQVSRALRALEQVGLVERDAATREYRLGWQLFGLAARIGEPRLLQLAPAVMRALVDQLDESMHLCVLQGTQVLTILTESPSHAFRASGWVGRSIPIHCSSAGRVLLADYSHAEIMRRFADVSFAPCGPVQLVHNLDTLFQQAQLARQAGYAIVREEFEPELVGVSAPVRDFRGQVIAALNLSAPKFRLDAGLEAAAHEVAAAAERLSCLLGWAGAQ